MIAYLKNEERIWEIPEGESAVGRGSDCTLPLDAGRYPEISRKHVRFTSKGGVVTFRDDNSANGTLKNGVRLSSGELHPGDTLELGAGGPMFEMWQGPVGRQDVTTKIQSIGVERMVSAADRAATPQRSSGQTAAAAPIPTPPAPVPTPPAPAVTAVTAPSPAAVPAPVRLPPAPEPEGVTREMPTVQVAARPVHDSATRVIPVVGARPGDPAPLGGPAAELRTVVMPRSASSSGAKPLQSERPRTAPTEDTTAVYEEDAFVPPPVAVRSAQYAMRADDSLELALEQKLALMQKLVVAVLVLAVALAGLLLYQSREIQQNHEAILALQQQASNSVSLLMPQLDQRMNRLNERLDALDPKMQKAEDHMAERMNHDLPILLDKYLASRMSTAQAMHPEAMIPH